LFTIALTLLGLIGLSAGLDHAGRLGAIALSTCTSSLRAHTDFRRSSALVRSIALLFLTMIPAALFGMMLLGLGVLG
jgi:hypothetical protein